ncbi:MAG: putative metal-binding motif-containing protein [Myxococcales bacterium]|nr:putative metal-binding motif-containing protein [Myxococcales bacterium]
MKAGSTLRWLARHLSSAGLLVATVVVLASLPRCNQQYALLLTIKSTSYVETFDLRVRERGDRTTMGKIVLERTGQPVDRTDITRDISKPGESLTISIEFDKPGNYVVYVLGRAGQGSAGQQYALRDFQIKEVEEASLTLVPLGTDADGDGYPACGTGGNNKFLDCNDNDPDVHPFAQEVCGNGRDDDCSAQCGALPAEGDAACVDNDGDGVPAPVDCDDNDPCRSPNIVEEPNFCKTSEATFPMLPKACLDKLAREGKSAKAPFCGDGIDQDCNGQDLACKEDKDCDGTSPPDDCDDNNKDVNPSAKEKCGDGIDNNCNGVIDEGCAPCDVDGDGHAAPTAGADCKDDKGQPLPKDDPDDFDSGIFPKVTATTQGKEGGTLLGALRGFCRDEPDKNGVSVRDVDHDGDGMPASADGCPSKACDQDGDGFMNASCNPPASQLDCNDNNPQIFPGAPDVCGDGVAQNCISDTPCDQITDKDGDKYADSVDCDDNNPNIHPWAKEVCDGRDNDCDGLVDEGNPDSTGALIPTKNGNNPVYLCNDSNDGECGGGNNNCTVGQPNCSQNGRALSGTCACSRQVPQTLRNENNRVKCSGENLAIDASARCFQAKQPENERCDNRDWDCNGRPDDPTGANPLVDKGKPCGTNVGNCKAGVVTGCDLSRTLPNATLVASVLQAQSIEFNPNWVCGPVQGQPDYWLPVPEVCNGKDDDCDGTTPNNEIDSDGDQYIACNNCNGTAQYALLNGLLGCGDCNANVGAVYPGATEICNNRDDNCANGTSDDGAGQCGQGGQPPDCCSTQSACRNLATDAANCGSCGNVCNTAVADGCTNRQCTCGGGPACGAGLNCVNGQCRCIQNGRCNGCCQGNTCVAGTAVSACGRNGNTCNNCDDSNECTSNQCQSNGTCNNPNLTPTTQCQGGNGRCLNGACCTTCRSGGNCQPGTTNGACGANLNGGNCGTCSAPSTCQSASCGSGTCQLTDANEGNACNSGAGTCRQGNCCQGSNCWNGSNCVSGTAVTQCGASGGSCITCPTGTECQNPTCNSGTCGLTNVSNGTPGSCSSGNGTCWGGACCSGNNCWTGSMCQNGQSSNNRCGSAGESCVDCTATGRTCSSGSCVCGGCVASGNQCVAGNTVANCGSGGGSCTTCTDPGACQAPTCDGTSCGSTPDNENGSCGAGGICKSGACCQNQGGTARCWNGSACVDSTNGACGTNGADCVACMGATPTCNTTTGVCE